jgi:hypothetical protein
MPDSFFDIDDCFSWSEFWFEIRHGKWEFGWDDRKPLPGWGGCMYMWYDRPHYALRLWRFYVSNL